VAYEEPLHVDAAGAIVPGEPVGEVRAETVDLMPDPPAAERPERELGDGPREES
jgi:hypothetical protein